jgi:hypothetical protein
LTEKGVYVNITVIIFLKDFPLRINLENFFGTILVLGEEIDAFRN